MSRPAPLFANDRNAAALLDMKPAEFRALVDKGVLPGPKNIAGYERWRVADLDAIASGCALDEEFEA